MRIIYLHQYFNTPEMSGGTRSYEMAKRLVARGHEVNLITSCRDANAARGKSFYDTDEDGIAVHWLPNPYSNKMNYLRRVWAFLNFALKAARKAESLKGDIIFASSTPLTIAFPAVYASKRKKIPMVFEVRDLWPELPIAIGALKNVLLQKAAKWLELFAYKNSAWIIALSPGMKEGIIKTGYPADRIEVIPNSCDIDMFSVDSSSGAEVRMKYDWLMNRPLVIYTGTIGVINGVQYLAQIASVVWKLDKEVRFLIIGEGKGEHKLVEEAKNLGVFNKNLFLMSSKPKSEMPAWLSAADIATSVFVDLKEMWNNSANKFFDALAAGKPIAINYKGWQAELLNDHNAGIVLSPDDAEMSARLIVEKINDKDWLDRAGKAAKRLAVEKFNRDELAKKLEKALITTLNKKPYHNNIIYKGK